ncbi:MAG: uncharacterized protein JWO03_269 [Bacteroidetes bacterium]|nr:uncharacterized protein [Bacteroidota bacterium]
MKIRRTFVWGLFITLVASALLGILIFLFGAFKMRELKVLFSTLDVSACSLAALCCATLLSTKFKWFSVLGVLTSLSCMMAFLYVIWFDREVTNYDFLLTLVVLTGTFAHISLILLTPPVNRTVTSILTVTVLCITLLGVMLLLMIWGDEHKESFYRTLGVIGILDVLGTIISPILGKTRRYEDALEG